MPLLLIIIAVIAIFILFKITKKLKDWGCYEHFINLSVIAFIGFMILGGSTTFRLVRHLLGFSLPVMAVFGLLFFVQYKYGDKKAAIRKAKGTVAALFWVSMFILGIFYFGGILNEWINGPSYLRRY